MDIQKELFALQDLKYKEFHSKLMPNIDSDLIIGVRTPDLRNFAKNLTDYEDFLKALPHKYYEENNLHGFLISQIKDFDRVIEELNRFLPYVDNWATCDMLRPKVFKKSTDKLISEILKWLKSDKTYTIRFGIEMLMCYYLDGEFKEEYLEWVSLVKSEEYYVNMMIAWYFATALAKQWDKTIPYITEKRLSEWVHKKTIQKAKESFRITKEQKEFLKNER